MSEKKQSFMPQMVADASNWAKASRNSRSRSSLKTGSDISGMLCNIDAGVTPFNQSGGDINVRDAVILCQKAYWNVAIFKLTIDIMSEFSNSPLHFKGRDKKSVKFFKTWFKKIGGSNLGDQFFRELFRSSNVFAYRVTGNLPDFKEKPTAKIPIRYIILNPADISCGSTAIFDGGSYKKILNEFEVSVLKNSTSEENVKLKRSLPESIRKSIDKGVSTAIPLKPDDIVASFFKKQDYEPFAVPMYFPVLFDINLKLEFKKAEQLIARACEYMILLVTVGDKDVGVDNDLVQSITELFKKESVGRVLVSDWTTKMDFVMPDLKKILGPEKYESVNSDISNGLMNIFFGEQKYADSMLKIKVFLERLKEARKVFITSFLAPEMQSICEELGFKECPEPVFEDVDLKNEVEYMKLYNRLAELGFLTQEETIRAYKTHILPENYESIVSHKDFKKSKEEGLYEPIGQSAADVAPNQSGRPTGTPQNQKAKTVTPVGMASKNYSISTLKDSILEADKLIQDVSLAYKEKYKIGRMSKRHREVAKATAFHIIQNEPMENWKTGIASYIEDPSKTGEIFDAVAELADEHNLDFVAASLLFHSENKKV